MTERPWTCPHCSADLAEPAPSRNLVVTCPRCGFMVPRPSELGEGTKWRDTLAFAETTTEKWGAVCSDRYLILRSLGSGAQGRILLAYHRHLDQLCVVKVLSAPDDDWKDIAIARLRAEAHAGASVNHPNVARVLDCDCVQGSWYFVMEYVDGVNLRRLAYDVDRLLWEQVAEIGTRTAEGLAAIHQASLIHRDIKPSNLMLCPDGEIKIMDLGLVKIRTASEDQAITHTGQMLGTPFYMAPEQFDAEAELDHRADLYALGATLYQLSVGHPPHKGGGVLDLARKHRHDAVVWPEECRENIPGWFREVIDACLAKKPDHRYESARVLAETLRAGLRGDTAARGPVMPSRRPDARGVAMLALQNLTQQETHAWVGDAIADYVTSRLMAWHEMHIADRNNLQKTLERIRERHPDRPEQECIREAGRLVGAGTIFRGSYQVLGNKLRVTVHAVTENGTEAEFVGEEAGTLDELFALEDRIATAVLERISRALVRGTSPHRGTQSLEATEKLTRAKQAFAKGAYHEAIRLAEEAQQADPEYLDPLSVMGVCYGRCGEYEKAAECHQRLEDRARALNDRPWLAEAFGNMGVMYYYQGAYALAHEFLSKAKAISLESNRLEDAAKYWGNLGFVLVRMNRYDEAEEAFIEAIEISKRFGDLVSLVWPYNGMGTVLLKQERFGEAQEYYNRALVLAQEVGDRVNIGVSHMNLGQCACLTGQFDEAQRRFNEALKTLEGTGFWNGLTLIYGHLAEMHLLMHQVDKALECIEQRIELARRHQNNRMEAEGWEQKAKAYEQMNRSNEALKCLKHSLAISQRLPPYESLHRYLEEVSRRPPFRS